MYYIENKESEPEWQGYGIVIGFVFVSVMLSMLQTRSFFTAENIALGVRTALMSAVYKKVSCVFEKEKYLDDGKAFAA